jgi:chromosome segregation protein
MRIRQIELIGFKSFADKIILKLHPGVTCIVGPNGCGKSNVVDSFRWVLGEQSAKSLRGDKMEEVIFQGSSTVKQKGMAEVTLALSQSAGRPAEGPSENGNGGAGDNQPQDEIIVSRRLYRSGESEYLMNKRQCRLKDIKDIFLDTGLDVKSYSIMDQGKVSEIINTKPQDRRSLIEEVAGVMKYKVRRAEALSKLESSKQNLQRINDIVYEVRRQINSLDRQVKKAERYKRLNDELKVIELRIAKREYVRLSGIVQELLANLERVREVDSSRRSELSTMENQLETKRLELVDKEKALTELENGLYLKEKEIAETEKLIAVLKTGMENRRADRVRLESQQKDFSAKKEELTAKGTGLEENKRTLSSAMAGLSDELADKKDSLAGIESAISEREEEIEEKRRELFRVSETLSLKKNEMHKLQSSLETLTYRESASVRDREGTQEGMAALTTTIAIAEENIRTAQGRHTELLSQRDGLTAETNKLGNDIEDKKALLAQEREALASTLSRLNSLKELTVDRSLHDFLAESGKNIHFSGLVLSDIINAGKDYEKSVEAALSEKVNSIILRTVEDIITAVSIIREKHLGRTAMFYTGFSSGTVQSHAPQPPPEGILGKASDFITYENEEFRAAAAGILENTYMVKDLETAIRIRKSGVLKDGALVTLEGEVIDRDGIILAGQGRDILKRKREIKELQNAVKKQQALIGSIENELSELGGSLASLKEVLRTAEIAMVDTEKELSLSDHTLQTHREEMQRLGKRLSFLDTETASIAEEKESITLLVAAKTAEIEAMERERAAVSEGITTMQNSLSAIKADYEKARALHTDMKLTIASYKEKIEAMHREAEGIRSALEELDRNRENAALEIGETEKKLSEAATGLLTLEESIKALVITVDALRQERAAKKEVIDTEAQAHLEERNSLKTIRTHIDVLAQELNTLNAQSVENRLRLENTENSIMQKYGIEIKREDVQIEGFDPGEDSDNVDQLNGKIRDLGPVNLGTIEEYEELKTRYDFLTKQQEDLTMSIAELEEAISRINSSTRRKLREAYDALREKFVEVFTKLFGGGRADLILTDEQNILESGLDIIAQPPGKKLQNIHLLSGGEKALASLALLFAGFLIKPSPLCILDEVDAPLDESNTSRFAGMIKDLSADTQFIIITHNKTTMEVADYLYGITMEQPGVSKALSLQFAELQNMP